MNLLFGEVIDLFFEDGVPMGKVRCGGARINVPVKLVSDIRRGDPVLVCDGVAISKVEDEGEISLTE